MTDTPIPGTPAYAAAGVALLAKTVHVWTASELVHAQASTGSASVLYASDETAARAARLLGVADEIVYSNERDGRIVRLREGVLEGIRVTISSVEEAPDGEVAA